MQLLIYDDTFDGLLTAIHHTQEKGLEQVEIVPDQAAGQWLFGGEYLNTDVEKVRLLLERFAAVAGKTSLKPVFLAYLADRKPREKLLLEFFLLTFREGKNVSGWLNHKAVEKLMTTARQVSHEIHRFTGLLRFQELADGSFYAPLEPDNHIIVPLARHFSRRMPDRRWMIHDLRRRAGILWDGREFLPAQLMADENQLPLSDDERFFQSCWKSFHRKISLEEKRNKKLQKQFMPLRYWKYLTEFK